MVIINILLNLKVPFSIRLSECLLYVNLCISYETNIPIMSSSKHIHYVIDAVKGYRRKVLFYNYTIFIFTISWSRFEVTQHTVSYK